MQKIKASLPAFSELSRRERGLAITCIALAVALLFMACITVNMRVNMQHEYTSIRNNMSEQLYTNLNMLMQTFDMTSVPNADVKNSVLPQMRNYFIASVTLNEMLTKCYGPRYQLLTEADVNSLKAAFNAYDTAFRSDAPTDLAQADMQVCITRVRELLTTRFADGYLRAGR